MTCRSIPKLADEYLTTIRNLEREIRLDSRYEKEVREVGGPDASNKKLAQAEKVSSLHEAQEHCLASLENSTAVTFEDALGKLTVAEQRLSDDYGLDVEYRLVADALRALKSL